MRWMLISVGVGFLVVGAIWTLQGINVLPGSFMTGQPFWARTGGLMLLLGLVLCVVGWRVGAARR